MIAATSVEVAWRPQQVCSKPAEGSPFSRPGMRTGPGSRAPRTRLSRGLPKGSRTDWVTLALNAALLLASVIALLTEPNKLAAPQVLGIAALGIECSFAGMALATRAAGAR